jgi:hypothetical protein
MEITPQEGGCWYCHKKDEFLIFSREFDTYLHIKCLKKALADDPRDREAKIMMREFEYD